MSVPAGYAAASPQAPPAQRAVIVKRAPRRALPDGVIFLIILAIVVVGELVTFAVLTAEATQTTSTNTCLWSFWIFNGPCSSGSVSTPQAGTALALIGTLRWIFLAIDIGLVVGAILSILGEEGVLKIDLSRHGGGHRRTPHRIGRSRGGGHGARHRRRLGGR